MADDAAAPEGELSKPAEPVKEPSSADATEDSSAKSLDKADDGDKPDADDETAEPDEADYDATVAEEGKPRMSHVRLATIVGLVLVVAFGGLVGWLGFRAYQSHQVDQQRKLFLQVGRQGALNLTTIDFAHVDDDVKRILDSATGTFYDEFQQRSQPFTDVVKQVKSKSVGSVTEAGLESESANDAQVLVAVAVHTTVEGQPDQQPRAWRMRISVQKVGDDAKVSNVEFVP
jgi:Mce-associated membrane protein